MPTLKNSASSAKSFVGGVEKIRRHRKRGSARNVLPSTTAALTSHHNWPEFADDISTRSSDQNGEVGKSRSLRQTSSNEDCCLACPYAKLHSIVAIQSIRQSGYICRPRCWSTSYPSIPRLKQHLRRAHCRPEFICRRCQEDFLTEELLDAHSSRVPMCDPGKVECAGSMTKSQEKRIKTKTQNISPEANWFAIWQILFTGQDPPASPYFENQVSLNLWDNALANDLEHLSAKVRERLHGALHLTQLQQAIIDQTVQQAVAEYLGDVHLRIAQNQTHSSDCDPNGVSASLVDRHTPYSAENMPQETASQVWSPSVMQSYLPRSMFTPGTTYHSSSMESDLSIGLPQTMQPNPNYIEQQHLGDYGDLFLGLSLNSYMSLLDNTQYHQWPAMAMSTARST